ncbi:hypothetical protein ACIA5D_09540 [Actinoplanes sp. NPDC051513]|uniref:hypothetical protein n=1 Tax=Actinoplanes sp. NPDC051513 TaxID=3363908 RepID=UPI0037A3AB0D
MDSFYALVGGEAAVTEAVDRLYRVILADDRLSPAMASRARPPGDGNRPHPPRTRPRRSMSDPAR